ncbi:DUF3024 domain-containing protein [Thioalkalivibrio sp. AKL10]|uniref:DUF3024 domain-containing protein n=1 Tax=Thioalkalivibrio sp. AKL10 TaxID=1158158 RepID=UPI00037D827C|nr:DUF3024 domain-containing protein [Thioalkalivibrio sp. AKL10]
MERRRPPAHLRDQVDLAYRIKGQSVLLFERRPAWDDSGRTLEIPIAKTTLVKKSGAWKIFWLRSDLAWHRHDPKPDLVAG